MHKQVLGGPYVPIELLRKIADTPLPLTITKDEDIDKLRVLRAAGYVTVMLPAADGDQTFARVLHITEKGRKVIGSTESSM